MKTKTGLTLALLFFISLMAFGGNKQQSSVIHLTGGYSSSGGGPSRIPQAPSFEAYLWDKTIDIYFLNDMDEVTVTVTSETGGLVYQSTESGDYGTVVSVDLQDAPSGYYLISFTKDDGSLFLQGVFDL